MKTLALHLCQSFILQELIFSLNPPLLLALPCSDLNLAYLTTGGLSSLGYLSCFYRRCCDCIHIIFSLSTKEQTPLALTSTLLQASASPDLQLFI